jgi:hypothetical protein
MAKQPDGIDGPVRMTPLERALRRLEVNNELYAAEGQRWWEERTSGEQHTAAFREAMRNTPRVDRFPW